MGHRPRTAPAWGRDWATPHYLFVGIDWHRKNGQRVVEAFAKVREQHPDATLDVVGSHPELTSPGVTGHGLISRGDATGQRKLDALYASATCFVLPSRFDPSPISCLEAGSAGLAVIATSAGGAGELLRGGSIVVDPLNSQDITAAMVRLADGGQARKMGVAAQLAASTCSWRHVAGRILDAAFPPVALEQAEHRHAGVAASARSGRCDGEGRP